MLLLSRNFENVVVPVLVFVSVCVSDPVRVRVCVCVRVPVHVPVLGPVLVPVLVLRVRPPDPLCVRVTVSVGVRV